MVLTVDSHLDFGGVAELRNTIFENAATAAGLTAAGMVDYVTADNHMHGHDGTVEQQIPWATDNGIFKPLAAAPAANVAGETWYDTANGVLSYNDGTDTKTVATIDQISTMFRTRAIAFDASATVVPVAGDNTVAALNGEPLAQGDVFIVGTGGTIAGIQGADTLEPGDMLVLMDGTAPTASASWFAFQTNVDLPSNILAYENVTLSLTAGVDATVTPAVLTGIHHIEMYDAADILRPTMTLTLAAGGGTGTVNSLNAITGARAFCLGVV